MSKTKGNNYHVFKSKGTDGTLTLDNGKRASHNELMNLDVNDLKRPIIKDMIKAGKKEDNSEDQLIKLKTPEKIKEAS